MQRKHLWLAAVAACLTAACREVPAAEFSSTASSSGAAQSAAAPDWAAAARRVDALLASEAAGAGQAVGMAEDGVFVRRAYLDFVGRNPTSSELTAFMLDRSAAKRTALVEALLASPEFGKNWGRYWRDVIFYRRIEQRALIAAPATADYFAAKLNAGAAWDDIARSIITATGDVRDNGATGLIMAQNGDASNFTAEVSRIFLGIQIQCAQCHDHNTDRWKRRQFHELAAFFPRIAVRPVKDSQPRSFEVVGNDQVRVFRPAANRRGSGEHYMPDLENPAARGTKMDPVFFLTGEKLPPGQTDARRRETAARLITSNEWFAKAFVNRVWAELAGQGFYEPVDDIGPDRQPNAPQTIDFLAGAFADSGYDVKWLYRTIAATAAYGRASRSGAASARGSFSANCVKRLRSDQIYQSLQQTLGIDETRQRGSGRAARGRPAQSQFDRVFGFDPSLSREEVSGSIPQALFMMNSPVVNNPIDGGRRYGSLGKLLSSRASDETVTVELYLRALGRQPNPRELQTCLGHVRRTRSRQDAFEDILWALVNSTEFLHRK